MISKVFVSNNVQKGQAKGSGSKGTKNTFSHFPLNLTPPPDSLSRFDTSLQDMVSVCFHHHVMLS